MIDVQDIHKTYRLGGADVHALRGCTLRIERGEFVAIVGPSGSGKSTLMHILGLLDVPDRGTFRLEGRDVAGLTEDERAGLRARSIGFVFQQFNLLSRVSALENVALPLIYSDAPPSASPRELLERVGLGDRLHHAPNELSGGQQQRVAIARALVNAPPIVMADEPTGNLDSASSQEILRILQALHASGLTVIVVTHEPEIAALAHRVITIRDGRVVEDTGRRGPATSGAAPIQPAAGTQKDPPAAADTAVRPLPARHWRRKLRETGSLLKQAGRSLAANKTRTFLSMLGVLIGVAAVIAVMALGTGAKIAVQERIASMGANLLVLRPGGRESRGVSLGAGAVSRLTLEDADALRAALPWIANVAPTVRGSAQVVFADRNWRTQVIGTTPAYTPMHSITPASGRFFTDEEVRERARVVVIGLTVLDKLFAGANPLGQTIRVNRINFVVVGVLPSMGTSFFHDENDQILIPVTTAMRRLLGKDYIDAIEMQTASADDLTAATDAAIAFAKKQHRVKPEAEDAFTVRNMADIQSAIASTSQTMSLLLGGIGIISLLVGGIGIMNIMLVSVAERTREIGIRKAIGARRFDILMQFLVESLVVSACGGLLGIALGWAISLTMTKLAGWTTAVTPQTVLTAFAFSAAVGVVFGLWPARKAAALEPIQALRYE